MIRFCSSIVVGVVVCVVVGAGCVAYEDHCKGFACGDGEVCIDLARGPTCVCDDLHEATDEGCEPLDDSGGSSG